MKRRKALGLLSYLASSQKPVHRSELIGMFWPDVEDSAARHAVSVALSDIKAISDELVYVDGQHIGLSQNVLVDLLEFERVANGLIAEKSGVDIDSCFDQVDRLFKGDFLENFDIPQLPEFSLWKSREAERLRQLYVDASVRSANSASENGDYTRASRYISKAIERDPLREELYAANMLYCYWGGNRTQALKQYHKMCHLLESELGVAPLRSTEKLYASIVLGEEAGEAQASSPSLSRAFAVRSGGKAADAGLDGGGSLNLMPAPASDLTFVGRGREAALLDAAIDGGCKVVSIVGEPGIGKTRFVCEYFRETDQLVCYSTAKSLRGAMYCQPIVAALRQLGDLEQWGQVRDLIVDRVHPMWIDVISRYIPGLFNERSHDISNNGAQPSGALLLEALTHLIEALCEINPTVIVIDDAHLADASVFELFSLLLTHSTAKDLRVVLLRTGSRFSSSRAELAYFELIHGSGFDGEAADITLGPLLPEEVTKLARIEMPNRAEELSSWLMRCSEGNPYYIKEAILRLRDSDEETSVSILHGPDFGGSAAVTESIASYVAMRLARLSDEAQQIAKIASVVGKDFDIQLVFNVGAYDEDALLNALDELCDAGLIKVDASGDVGHFDHGITREAIYDRLGVTRRKSLHKRLAQELEREEGPSSAYDAMAHYRSADMHEDAARCAISASEAMFCSGSWQEGLDLLNQGTFTLSGEEQLIYFKRQGIMLCAMHSDRAAGMYENAAFLAQELGHEAFATHCRGVAAMMGFSGVYEVMCGMPVTLVGDKGPAEAYEHLLRAEEMLASCDTTKSFHVVEYCDNKLALGLTLACGGSLTAAVERFRSGVALAQQFGGREPDLRRAEVVLRMNLCSALVDLRDPSAMDEALLGLRIAEDYRLHYATSQFLVALCKCCLDRGEMSRAKRYLDRAEAEANVEVLPYIVSYVQEQRARYEVLLGETAVAAGRFRVVLEIARSQGFIHQAVRVGLALVELQSAEEAAGTMEDVKKVIRGSKCTHVRLESGSLLPRGRLV